MHEAYDDCRDDGLEDWLEEDQITDLDNADGCLDEVDLAIADLQGDLYRLHRDSYLEEIESRIDEVMVRPEIDDRLDWQDEVNTAMDRERRR